MPRDYHTARQVVADAMPGTQTELVAKTGLCRRTVQFWIKDMREHGHSHIVGWKRPKTTGIFVPVHAFGAGKDRPCNLKPLTRAQRWKNHTENLKARGDDILRQRGRARYWCKKAARQGDELVNALFGRAA